MRHSPYVYTNIEAIFRIVLLCSFPDRKDNDYSMVLDVPPKGFSGCGAVTLVFLYT